MTCPHCQRENPRENAYCGSCGARLDERDPRPYAPPHLADAILRERAHLEGERKLVTVLFADVCESTALAERLGPEAWHRILEELFRILTAGIYRYEGTVNQFTGDGVMALFGAPLAHEDHARRACEAALHLTHRLRPVVERLDRRGVPLGLRMGIHSGEVVVGKIGDDLRMDYTAQGAAVSVAARLEELAPPGAILISEHTARAVEGLFELEALGPRELRGVREPVGVLRLLGPGPHRSRLDVARARGLSPLVGRTAELDALRAALRAAGEGSGRAVAVVGEPGVGKSRLGAELAREARGAGFAVFAATCPSHARNVPHLYLQVLLRAYFGVAGDEPAERVRERVVGRLHSVGLAQPSLAELACALLEGAEPGAAAGSGSDARRLELLHRLVQAQSAREPTLWLLDDVQWSDAESGRALAEMVDALGWTRTLLVATLRREHAPPWSETGYASRLVVPPLDRARGRELAEALLGDDPSLGGLAARIAERTGGNPLFAEAVVRDLADRALLVGEPGRYRAPRPLDPEGAFELPETVQGVLAARVDALAEPARGVLAALAVVGRRAEPSLLAVATGLTPDALAPALRTLEEAGLVDDLALAHPLLQDVVYRSLLGDRRQALHRAVAQGLEERHAEELGRVAALLAYHWEAGDRRGLARRWRHRAALRVAHIQLRRP